MTDGAVCMLKARSHDARHLDLISTDDDIMAWICVIEDTQHGLRTWNAIDDGIGISEALSRYS